MEITTSTTARTQDQPSTSRTTPLFEDQIRNYRQRQRRLNNARQVVGRLQRRITGRSQLHNQTLEQQIDPQVQLRNSMQERAAIIPAEVMYHSRRDDEHHRVYVHRSEEALLCTDNQQQDRIFIQEESFKQLQRSRMQFIHIGVIQLRIQALHRHDEGTLALVVFRDNRWPDDRSLFATMEVDLSQGSQLVYVIPNTMMTIGDFYNNVQVSILTRGYEAWRGEANLLITRGLVGRLSNTPNVGFAYEVQSVVDYLVSHGVRAIPGRRRTVQELQGYNWVVRPTQASIPRQPTEVDTRTNIDGTISLRFGNYTSARTSTTRRIAYNLRDEEIQSDEEQIIAVFKLDCYEAQPAIWDTLGEPSGKFGYYVRYDTHDDNLHIPLEHIIATGWDDDDDDCTTSSSDEASYLQHLSNLGGTSVPIEQDLPYPVPISDMINPFASTEGGGDKAPINNFPIFDKSDEEEEILPSSDSCRKEIASYIAAAFPENNADDEIDYPQLKNLQQHLYASPSAITGYKPPQDVAMGPPNYGPTPLRVIRPEAGPSRPAFEGYKPGEVRYKTKDYSEWWNLPSAQYGTGAIFIIPTQLGMFNDTFMRWESITKNLVSQQGFTDPNDKVEFIENLLGEAEKIAWIQWRMTFLEAFQQMLESADGRQGTQNILSQIRRVFTLEDPYQGSTAMQEEALRDLEKLSCHNLKDIVAYMNEYMRLASKQGRLFINEDLLEKFWFKMPDELGPRIKEAYEARYPGNTIGVFPRVLFAYKFLENECRDAAYKRSLKSLSFYSSIPILGYYKTEKKYGVRRSRTYKGKPHASHARIERRKHLQRNKRCKCYLCGQEGHFARECPNDRRSIKRVVIFENLDLPEDCDIVSVQEGDNESDAIYSISEGEEMEDLTKSLNVMSVSEHLYYFREEDQTYCIGGEGYRSMIKATKTQHDCNHVWEYNGAGSLKCFYYKEETSVNCRMHCPQCLITTCNLCALYYFGQKVPASRPSPIQYNPLSLMHEQQGYITWCEAEITRLKQEVETSKKQTEYWKQKYLSTQEEVFEKEFDELYKEKGKGVVIQEATNVVRQIETQKILSIEKNELSPPKKTKNMLYNLILEINIPDVANFSVHAILDTGASTCCINAEAIPENAVEEIPFMANFSGINSKVSTNKKLRYGKMIIGDNAFRIPYTYVFPMQLGDDIQMILGCNFIRSMQGGVRIEGDTVAFYKNVTQIQTQQTVPIIAAIEELELEEEEYISIAAICAYGGMEISSPFQFSYQKLIQELKDMGYIGDDPMKYWSSNKITCQLEIKNPDLTIEDRPLKHISPQMEASYRRHTEAVLKLGTIRPSKSKHRTTAIIVNSGTTIDPITGKEVRGKERMVFNYKRLNDNTHKDQYSLPGINTIIQKVGNSKIYSKFDLKSGFHQVAMHPYSIEWTAFWVPQGLYEWLAMPFGLKNAPAVFQRKMDNCFKGTENFIAVYIDDILVFSETEREYARHLEIMLEICKKNGLILSNSKMKIAVSTIDFLGATIGNRKIKLQEHTIKKIADYPEKELMNAKGLRSWLGILNHARSYIPYLGKQLGPLYSKVSPTGERKMNQQDWAIVKQIKEKVQNLPDLELPPPDCHIVLETDGCMDGWGGVCKWKPQKCDGRRMEKICAYASGKFSPPKSTIDAEIHAVMNSLNSFKIYYLDKKELLIRTDCQAIISFFNKSAKNKPSRVRWVSFTDFITGTGLEIRFQHIDEKDNALADALSRLVHGLVSKPDFHSDQTILLVELAIAEAQAKPQPGKNFQLTKLISSLAGDGKRGRQLLQNTKGNGTASKTHDIVA
uniref:RNA-directed DNA polymerase n=1 Tax=Taro bacilliform CH virus TaxID=1634914 RepID=A0A0E3GJS8_9VIRU|nr:polyprotein [Taro bacilliform CH virus]